MKNYQFGFSVKGFLSFIFMLVRKESIVDKRTKWYVGFGIFSLAGYYLLWIFYFAGVISPWQLVGMAVMPSLYFMIVGVWLRNYIAIIPSVVFGIIHIAITCSNYL